MRLLGLDVGARRIGMAVSDPFGITAQGAGFIERRGAKETIGALGEVARRHNVGGVIVGFPLNMGGAEGASARAVRVFSERLERILNIPVVLWDERLTTVQAEKAMKAMGLSRKKRARHLDEAAAQIILQSYLDSRTEYKSQTRHAAGKS